VLNSLTRSERVIIVEDDRVRSVVIGPGQRLRPAFFVALACAFTLAAVIGWALTAAELLRTREAVNFMEEGNRILSAELGESRAQVAALGEEMTGVRDALTLAMQGEEQVRARVEAALADLTVTDMKDTAQAARTLRTALAAARAELTPLGTLQSEQLSAAARSLDQVEAVSRDLAIRRAQAALAAVEMAASRADATLSGGDVPAAEGLALALQEVQAESARLRNEAESVRAERDQAQARLAEVEGRMQAMAEGQVQLVTHLTEQTDLRIGQIESALEETGLNLERLVAAVDREKFGQGGPLLVLASLHSDVLPAATTQAMAGLETRLQRQERLRALLHLLPLSAPADDFYISSDFGMRLDPFTGQRAMHTGLDLVGKLRSPIYATAPGTVVEATYDRSGYGRMVLVDHGFGIQTRYAHLDRMQVKPGDAIALGQQVGTLGNTGRSTGPHLHYEILIDGRTVDPMRFMERGRHVCQG
jgi:murein DD-endopeptidase MepM/ murein hydrolase activator NlpD